MEGEGWTNAEELRTGDQVRQADGTTGTVWLRWNVEKTQEMYNLTVDEAHTFFVGDGQWLVHNCADANDLEIARQLQRRLGNTGRGNTTFAMAADGTLTASSLYKPQLGAVPPQYPYVLQLGQEMGFNFERNIVRDVPGFPGSYYANHAEAQLSVAAPNQVLAVSNAMCETSCMPFYQALASYQSKLQIVADPYDIRLFFPNGTIRKIKLK